MESLVPVFLALFVTLLSVSVEAKKKDAATSPPKRLKVETTFTPANCNRKSRKSKAEDRLKINYVSRPSSPFLPSLNPVCLSIHATLFTF
jgi:hypothetical protein